MGVSNRRRQRQHPAGDRVAVVEPMENVEYVTVESNRRTTERPQIAPTGC
jgi:hypothetical protein